LKLFEHEKERGLGLEASFGKKYLPARVEKKMKNMMALDII
jgi:hypothetical protein